MRRRKQTLQDRRRPRTPLSRSLLRFYRSIVARREDVGEQRKVLDLFQSLVLVRKFEKVKIRIRRHHVIGLAADPSTHVDVAESGAGAIPIDIQADAGLAFPAVAAAPARDVERDGNQVAHIQELY